MIFTARSANIAGAKHGLIEIAIEMDERDIVQGMNINIDKLLDEIGLDAVLKHFDHRKILDVIGE